MPGETATRPGERRSGDDGGGDDDDDDDDDSFVGAGVEAVVVVVDDDDVVDDDCLVDLTEFVLFSFADGFDTDWFFVDLLDFFFFEEASDLGNVDSGKRSRFAHVFCSSFSF